MNFLKVHQQAALRSRGLGELGKTKQDTKRFQFYKMLLSRGRRSGITFVYNCEKVKRQRHTERIRELNALKNLVRGQMVQNIQ